MKIPLVFLSLWKYRGKCTQNRECFTVFAFKGEMLGVDFINCLYCYEKNVFTSVLEWLPPETMFFRFWQRVTPRVEYRWQLIQYIKTD